MFIELVDVVDLEKGIAITLIKMKDQVDIMQFKKMRSSYKLNIIELPDEITLD